MPTSPSRRSPPARRGFTLVELSIVLVVVGLLAGGVLVGRDLIKSAEIRATVSQLAKYETAVAAFELKYDGLPGDLPNATQFFSPNTANGCTSGNIAGAAAGPPAGVCNGNGDGALMGGCAALGQAICTEGFYMWVELRLAGLIPEQVRWGAGGSKPFELPGVSVPAARMNQKVGLSLYTFGSGAFFANPAVADRRNPPAAPGRVWRIAAADAGQTLTGLALPPVDARSLDLKLDDGNARTGRLVGNYVGTAYATCADSNGVYYNKSHVNPWETWWDPVGCVLNLRAGF